MKSWQCFGVALVVLLFVNNINSSNVLAQDTSCLNVLAPCLNYLNGTRHPPDICCDPLKSVIKSNPKCMCSMISNRGTTKAEQAGINITEAQQLPARCGQHVNPISCLSSKPPTPWPFFPYVCDPIQLFFVCYIMNQLILIRLLLITFTYLQVILLRIPTTQFQILQTDFHCFLVQVWWPHLCRRCFFRLY